MNSVAISATEKQYASCFALYVRDVNSRVDAGLLQVLAALERESKPARDNKDE